jgi:hypothetical protein
MGVFLVYWMGRGDWVQTIGGKQVGVIVDEEHISVPFFSYWTCEKPLLQCFSSLHLFGLLASLRVW